MVLLLCQFYLIIFQFIGAFLVNIEFYVVVYACIFIIIYCKGIPGVHIESVIYTVNYGKRVTLNCTVISSPPHLEVYWVKNSTFYNGINIIRHGEFGTSGSTTNNPSLTINTARTSDRGNYTCVAKNLIGTGSSHPTILEVKGGKTKSETCH